jgi:tetratricopeptide (TPR) repeat protein
MFEEAISNYRKAISIDPNDEILYYNLGRAYFEQGDREKAVVQLKSALTKKPDFSDAQEFLSKIQPQ